MNKTIQGGLVLESSKDFLAKIGWNEDEDGEYLSRARAKSAEKAMMWAEKNGYAFGFVAESVFVWFDEKWNFSVEVLPGFRLYWEAGQVLGMAEDFGRHIQHHVHYGTDGRESIKRLLENIGQKIELWP